MTRRDEKTETEVYTQIQGGKSIKKECDVLDVKWGNCLEDGYRVQLANAADRSSKMKTENRPLDLI